MSPPGQGLAPIEAAEERRRVLPAVEAIRQATSLPISIDRYNHEVVAAALDVGATIVNSAWVFGRRAAAGTNSALTGVTR